MIRGTMIGARLILALVAIGSAGVARAADDACLTAAELDATLAYALPTVITAAAQTCRPALAPDGYLTTQSADLAAHYRGGQAAAWPVARAAVLKIGRSRGLGAFATLLPDSALQSLASGTVGQFMEQTVHPADCAEIEQVLRLTAPLPPENTAGLLGLIVRRIERTRPGPKNRLPLCPPNPAPIDAVSAQAH